MTDPAYQDWCDGKAELLARVNSEMRTRGLPPFVPQFDDVKKHELVAVLAHLGAVPKSPGSSSDRCTSPAPFLSGLSMEPVTAGESRVVKNGGNEAPVIGGYGPPRMPGDYW